MRLLRTLVPLVLVAGLVAACGGGSSSAAGPVASGKVLQLRPVFAKYDSHAPAGEQLGPQAPKALLDTLKSFDCSSAPKELQGLLVACDSAGAVYVLKDPLTTGGVASAVAKPIHGEKLWWVELSFDTQATSTLAQAVDTMPGTEMALVVDGQVVSAPLLQASMSDGTLGVTGDYDEQQAKQLATTLAQG